MSAIYGPGPRLKEMLSRLERETAKDIANTVAEWLKPGVIELRVGEMTAQELRTCKAVVRAIVADIQAYGAAP